MSVLHMLLKDKLAAIAHTLSEAAFFLFNYLYTSNYVFSHVCSHTPRRSFLSGGGGHIKKCASLRVPDTLFTRQVLHDCIRAPQILLLCRVRVRRYCIAVFSAEVE